MKNVTGKPDFPLTVTWLSGQPPEDRLGDHGGKDSAQREQTFPSFPSGPQVGYNGFVSRGYQLKRRETVKFTAFVCVLKARTCGLSKLKHKL